VGLPEVRKPPSPIKVVAVCIAAVAVCQGFARFSYGLLLPPMVADLVGTYDRAGLLGSLNLGAYLVGIVGVSLLSTRIPPLWLLRVGLAGTVMGMFVLAVSPSYEMLVVGMVIAGVSSAGGWVPATAVVSAAVSGRHRGLAIGLVTGGVGISIVIAGLFVRLANAVVGPGAWREVWALQAITGVVALLTLLVVLRRGVEAGREQERIRLSALRAIPGWLGLTLAYAAFGLGYTLYITFVVTALEVDGGFTSAQAAGTYAVLGTTSIVGGVILGRLSDRLGRRRTLLTSSILLAACALMVLPGRQPWAALSAAIFGLIITGVGTVIAAHIGDHLRGGAVSAAFGMVTIWFGIMQAAGPSIGGWLAEWTGSFTTTFALSAATFVLCGVAVLSLPRDPSVPLEGSPPPVPPGDLPPVARS
jgi:predicted MFS family arabinose efflux permease